MIKFGTSGFRGIMGDTFTKESVRRVAAALLQIIEKNKIKNPKIVVGFDNRFMGRIYAEWMTEVLSTKATVDIFTISVPSPTITWMTNEFDFGIVITASHNAYMYNGIKLFTRGAKELDEETSREIEDIANALNSEKIEHIDFKQGITEGKIIGTENYQAYCDSLLTHFNTEVIKKGNLRVLANAMHGTSVDCLKYIFNKLNIKDYVIQNDNIDPYFGDKLPAPYVQNLQEQACEVVSGGYDLGVALDGDSDRFTLISSNGKIFDCNYVAAVLYYYLLTQRGFRGGIAKNRALTSLVEKIAAKFGFACYNFRVGFKHIAAILETTDAFMGAESNGISFKNHILTKDGIFVVVAVLEILSVFKKPFHEILENLQKEFNFKSVILEFAYPISNKKKKEITDLLFKQAKYPNFENRKIVNIDNNDGCKINYENGYWGLIRFSGNEPVIRIFSEMKDKETCDKMFASYEKFLGISERQ